MRLLLNEPVGEDSFDGGASKWIADELVRQIKTPDQLYWDRDRKCSYPVSLIGLKGAWGSGKSNVIRMVKKRIDQSSEYVLFEYDAWGHRQDFSRKMFLEELVESLCEKGLVNDEWRQKVAKLTAERKDTERESTPELNWPILLYLLSFVSTPFWGLISDSCPSARYKGAIRAVPIILGVGAFACSVIYNWFSRRDIRYALSRSLWLLKEKKIDYKATEWTHSYDPSVHCFTKFLGELLISINKKTLIVVLDNVDRLMPKEVANFLGAIHIIFAGDRHKRPSNLRVIVPYDAAKLEAAMQESSGGNFYAEDYAFRTFDVVYRVGCPLFSEWESFFKERYMLSASDDGKLEREYKSARNLVDILVPKHHLTPRKMISLINRIAQTRNMFADTVPFEDIVLYACSWQDALPPNETIEEWIVDGKFLENNEYQKVYLEGDEHKIAIAQIVYQVERDKAASVLLNSLTKQALVNGDAAQFRKLYEIDGFHHSFVSALKAISDFAENDKLERVTESLSGLDDVRDKGRYWDEFYSFKKDIIELDAVGKQFLTDASRRILSNITKWGDYAAFLRNRSQGNNNPFDWWTSSSIAIAIEETLRKKGLSQVRSVEQEIVAPETMLRILSSYRSNWKLANMQCSVEELDDFVANRLVNESDIINESKTFLGVSFLDVVDQLKMRKTRNKLMGLGINDKNRPELVNAYLALLESVSDEQIDVRLDRENIDVFWNWALEQAGEDCVARGVILAWRYGGFPYNKDKVKEYLSKSDASYARLEDLGRIWPHYFSKEELIEKLEKLISNNRNEFLIYELYKQVKSETYDP